jgi:transcriptional regulator with XRE-family HTH domain
MRKKEIPDSVKIIGNNIKMIIKEKSLKVRHVAHDSDLDIEALRRYILGKQIMGIDKLVRISKALNVEISELFQNM